MPPCSSAATLFETTSMSVSEQIRPPTESSAKLKRYLRAGLSEDLSLHNRISLLWAASVWEGLLSASETEALVAGVVEAQRPDGGFRLMDLGSWESKDGTPPSEDSDGYATAFTTFVLQRLALESCAEAVAGGIAWLQQNQQPDGSWETLSPNKDRSQEEDFTRLLASDAATGFGVLALTANEGVSSSMSSP